MIAGVPTFQQACQKPPAVQGRQSEKRENIFTKTFLNSKSMHNTCVYYIIIYICIHINVKMITQNYIWNCVRKPCGKLGYVRSPEKIMIELFKFKMYAYVYIYI